MADLSGPLGTALADRYELKRELGTGGMATVYLAHDLRHDRDVALKVLRPDLAASIGADRFLREIRTTARLQHPHSVALFDSGEAAGFLYYVMPYLEGESLRARLEREQRLDVDAMLAIARPVAQALAYAHEQGIVHRDIKPENILLSRGQPFVTDFGIARALAVAGGERLTATGVAVGTPAYMSPEQVLGEDVVDARSDVYSLGCVIYEMLSGSPPFSGATVQALLAKRLTGSPPHITTVPVAVDEVVRKSLATAPQDRFATAIALADALVEAARKPTTPELSIVVLPFENLSPDPDNAFFADGLTEELTAALSKIRALRVISRTSAMMYKGVKKSAPDIARDLNVRHVLEGSVRRAGNSLRITAQMIDAVTDAHVWADAYTGTPDDVFGLQERVARAIAEALQITLDAATSARLSERPIISPEAFEWYVRALQEMWQFTEVGLARALVLLERALALEPESAQLHGALAYVLYQHANMGFEPVDGYRRKARAAAERAMALDAQSAVGHLAAGLLVIFEDPRTGIQHLKLVLAREPGQSDALWWLAAVCALCWKPAAALPYFQRLMTRDPLHPAGRLLEGHIQLLSGQFGDAEQVFRSLLAEGQGPSTGVQYHLGLTLAYMGKCDEAVSHFERIAAQDQHNIMSRVGRGFVHALRGERDRARQVLTMEVHKAARRDFACAEWVAACHALIGDVDDALEWVEQAVNLGMINYPFLNEYDPFLAPLRSDPRFRQLMERVKHEWETFEI